MSAPASDFSRSLFALFNLSTTLDPSWHTSPTVNIQLRSGVQQKWSLEAPFPFCEIRLKWTRNTRKKSRFLEGRTPSETLL